MTLHKVPDGHVLLKCTCQHELQDKKYGEGMRPCEVVSFRTVQCVSCGALKVHYAGLAAGEQGESGE